MDFNEQEIQTLKEAVSVYAQVVAHKQGMRSPVLTTLKSIAEKIQGKKKSGNELPAGISEEHEFNVCHGCNNYSDGGCTDKVAHKFPGKCDPILHYERDKNAGEKTTPPETDKES